MARRYGKYYEPKISSSGVKIGLLEKRADDYVRMVNAIKLIEQNLSSSFIPCEYEILREENPKEYAAWATLKENGIVCSTSCYWVPGKFVQIDKPRSYRTDGYYEDGEGHSMGSAQYKTLCDVFSKDYVKNVLHVQQNGYRYYIPGHHASHYELNQSAADEIRALEQSFRTICSELKLK